MTEPIPGDEQEAEQGTPSPIPDPPDTEPVEERSMADSAALSKSWDHAAARKEIKDLIGGEQGREVDAQIEILGADLAGKAAALGYWGAPGARGDVDVAALSEPWGGYWGVQTDNVHGGFELKVWKGSEVVHTETGPNPQDTLAVGQAHGLSLSLDGPA